MNCVMCNVLQVGGQRLPTLTLMLVAASGGAPGLTINYLLLKAEENAE